MNDFNTNLLREKFIIRDVMPDTEEDAEPVIALSNRLELPFVSDSGNLRETLVVRAQNMHTCARLGAQIARDFQERGPLMERKRRPFDWRAAYLSITKGYEKSWNPGRWVAVYYKGRIVFQDGEANKHPFLDIIEQCDARNKGDYEDAVKVAEDAFQQAGKRVTIEHDSNIALVVNINKDLGRCGVIVRGPNKTTTFNFGAKKKADRVVRISQCLTASAAFLEGIQLAFFIGMTQQKVFYELVDDAGDEAKQLDDAQKKLGRLNNAISQFENLLDVSYRPDRPNTSEMISEAEEFARKIFAAEVEKRIKEGGDKAEDWIV